MKINSKSSILITIFLILITIVFSVIIFLYIVFISTIDVKYISKIESALKNYDISELDMCLSEDAEIYYKDEKYEYLDCRNNIYENMKKRNYTISMYGGGNNKFSNNIQKINTQVYGKVLNKNYGESNIIIYLKKFNFKDYKIIKLESNDEIFEEIFLKVN